jgi:hypothetical protein
MDIATVSNGQQQQQQSKQPAAAVSNPILDQLKNIDIHKQVPAEVRQRLNEVDYRALDLQKDLVAALNKRLSITTAGFVYVLGVPEWGKDAYKFGETNNMETRLTQYVQHQLPPVTTIKVYLCPDSKNAENHLKFALAPFRALREIGGMREYVRMDLSYLLSVIEATLRIAVNHSMSIGCPVYDLYRHDCGVFCEEAMRQKCMDWNMEPRQGATIRNQILRALYPSAPGESLSCMSPRARKTRNKGAKCMKSSLPSTGANVDRSYTAAGTESAGTRLVSHSIISTTTTTTTTTNLNDDAANNQESVVASDTANVSSNANINVSTNAYDKHSERSDSSTAIDEDHEGLPFAPLPELLADGDNTMVDIDNMPVDCDASARQQLEGDANLDDTVEEEALITGDNSPMREGGAEWTGADSSSSLTGRQRQFQQETHRDRFPVQLLSLKQQTAITGGVGAPMRFVKMDFAQQAVLNLHPVVSAESASDKDFAAQQQTLLRLQRQVALDKKKRQLAVEQQQKKQQQQQTKQVQTKPTMVLSKTGKTISTLAELKHTEDQMLFGQKGSKPNQRNANYLKRKRETALEIN